MVTFGALISPIDTWFSARWITLAVSWKLMGAVAIDENGHGEV